METMGTRSLRQANSSNVSMSAIAPAIAPAPQVPPNTTRQWVQPVPKAGKFNPTLAVVVVSMIISFFLVGFATGYFRRWIRGAEAESEAIGRRRRLSRRPSSQAPKPQRGLDQAIVEALPLVQYKDLAQDEQGTKFFDCAVCLAAFDPPDAVKLLPVCAHAFHSDCIGEWFRLHTTCPLCRVCLAHSAAGGRRDDAQGVPEGFDVVEVVISGDPERESVGAADISGLSQATAEEEVNARPLLWSNAAWVPFRPAVRGDVAPEKGTALASIRRSSSVGAGLQLCHGGYVVDSEGTQHNTRSVRVSAMAVGDFVSKDQDGAQARSEEFPTSRPVGLVAIDVEGGASSAARPTPQWVWPSRRSFSNLRQIAPIWR